MSSSGLCTCTQLMDMAHIRACANIPQQSGVKFWRNTRGGDKDIGRKERFKDEELKGGGKEERRGGGEGISCCLCCLLQAS